MSDILELLQLQKNIQDFQAHQESCRRHAKIFTSFTDFLKILQLQLQCSGPPGTSGVLWKSYKKKSTSLTDILEPLQLQKNVQDLQAL